MQINMVSSVLFFFFNIILLTYFWLYCSSSLQTFLLLRQAGGCSLAKVPRLLIAFSYIHDCRYGFLLQTQHEVSLASPSI